MPPTVSSINIPVLQESDNSYPKIKNIPKSMPIRPIPPNSRKQFKALQALDREEVAPYYGERRAFMGFLPHERNIYVDAIVSIDVSFGEIRFKLGKLLPHN